MTTNDKKVHTVHRLRPPRPGQQGLSVEKLLYFFLGVRKGDIRLRVERLKHRYPDETPRQLSARVIAAQRPLSLLGGALLGLPALVPATSTPFRLIGLAGAASALAQMHTAMVLEIALIHGFDIDDRARLKDLMVVLAATGLMSAAPDLARRRGLGATLSVVSGTLMVSSMSELIGRSAVAFYGRRMRALNERAEDGDVPHPAPSAGTAGTRR